MNFNLVSLPNMICLTFYVSNEKISRTILSITGKIMCRSMNCASRSTKRINEIVSITTTVAMLLSLRILLQSYKICRKHSTILYITHSHGYSQKNFIYRQPYMKGLSGMNENIITRQQAQRL